MPTPYSPGWRQSETQRTRIPARRTVRNLDQDAGAIAGFRIAAACAAMRQVNQDLHSLDDDVVGLHALDVDYKADTAGIMLVAGVIKTLGRR